jgi:uncharacterized membrane protein
MSGNIARPEVAGTTPRGALPMRVLLAIAYPLLAHWATLAGDGRIAALAMLDIVLVVLGEGLLRARASAWAGLAVAVLVAAWLARGPHALLPLLLAPPAFVAAVGWAFARTLGNDRIPLVGRIAAAIDGVAWLELPAAVRAYARRVTLAWALLLASLATLDLVLALLAQPGGILPQLGVPVPFAVAESGWSWFANIGDYVVIGGFLLAEYAYRRARFPDRTHGLAAFAGGMARLGPAFWREALR